MSSKEQLIARLQGLADTLFHTAERIYSGSISDPLEITSTMRNAMEEMGGCYSSLVNWAVDKYRDKQPSE